MRRRLAKLADDLPQLPPRLRIQPRRRLVQKQQLRVPHQRAGHRQPLLLPAGKISHPRFCFLLQRHPGHHFFRLHAAAIKAAKQRQRFPHAQFFRQPRFLQRDADPLADFIVVLAPAVAQHFDLAGRGVQQPLDDFDRRRFPRPVGPQQSKALPLLDGQIQPAHRIHRRLGVVALRQILALNRKHRQRIIIAIGPAH